MTGRDAGDDWGRFAAEFCTDCLAGVVRRLAREAAGATTAAGEPLLNEVERLAAVRLAMAMDYHPTLARHAAAALRDPDTYRRMQAAIDAELEAEPEAELDAAPEGGRHGPRLWRRKGS